MPVTTEGNGVETLDVKMFGRGRSALEYGDLATQFVTEMTNAHTEAYTGKTAWSGRGEVGTRTIRKGLAAQNPKAVLARFDQISKSFGADDSNAAAAQELAEFRREFSQSIEKDWTPSNPVGGTGLVPYDLEAPAKVLVPLYTPLRNSIPREKGQGNARKFKRVDSFSNAGIPNGAGQLLPFFNSQTQTSTWGPTGNLTLARPQKINYTGSDWTVSYVELGLSDSVDWISQFEGLGFDDIRALSHTALLFSHLMGEERAMLYARGATGGGYSGIVAAPGNPTTVVSTTGGALPAQAGGYFIYVTSNTGQGESVVTTVANTAAVTGTTSSVAITLPTEATGALAYNLYAGTVTGIANAHFQGSFAGNPFTWTAYNSTSAVATGVDTSFNAAAYDGFLTIQSNPALSGYFNRANAVLNVTNPGQEFDNALAAMYTANGADPDEIWMTGANRTELTELMRKGGASGFGSGYRTNIVAGDGNVTMGTVVGGFLNPNTGKVLDVRTHRFMLPGNALIRSVTLPLENSRVTSPVSMVNVQDYMAVDWPDIQMTYDTSTYQIGSMLHRAPSFSGLIVGIQ